MKKRILLLTTAFVLLLASAIGNAFAYFKAESTATNKVTIGNLSIDLFQEDDKNEETQITKSGMTFQGGMPGDTKKNVVYAKNTADYPLYLRVTITKYWEGKEEEKEVDLNPEFIGLVTKNLSNWIVLDEDENHEVVEMYYKKSLSSGEKTDNILDELKISSYIGNGSGNDYAGAKIRVNIEADAIQQISAQKAILSEWGMHVTIGEDGILQQVSE